MSNAAANKVKLERAYRDWHESRGKSVEELIAVFDDDVRFGSLGQGAEPVTFTAPRVGKEHMRGYFDGLLLNWDMIHYTIDYMIAEGDRVAAIGSTAWTCKATGKSVETPKVDVWLFKDGRAVEFYEYFDTAQVFAAATAMSRGICAKRGLGITVGNYGDSALNSSRSHARFFPTACSSVSRMKRW